MTTALVPDECCGEILKLAFPHSNLCESRGSCKLKRKNQILSFYCLFLAKGMQLWHSLEQVFYDCLQMLTNTNWLAYFFYNWSPGIGTY